MVIYTFAVRCCLRIAVAVSCVRACAGHHVYTTAVMKSCEMRYAGHVARIAKNRTVYRIVVGTPEGKTPLGRLRLSMNTGWTVRGSNPLGGEIFRTRSDRP